MKREHHYELSLTWTGNTGKGTETYTEYERSHSVSVASKTPLELSSDPSFRGDKNKYNPEELLVASLSSCHMLWFLHLCSESGVVVESYTDKPMGIMVDTPGGTGHFTEVTLNPEVTLRSTPPVDVDVLHRKANELCYIANSCKFPVHHNAKYSILL